jgi:hypothetical protein
MGDEDQTERRKAKRVPFIKDATVEGLGARRISDLSVGGLYLETPVSVPVGTDVDIRFKLDDSDSQEVELKARVIYIHEGVGMGMVFVNLPPEIAEKINKLVDHS